MNCLIVTTRVVNAMKYNRTKLQRKKKKVRGLWEKLVAAIQFYQCNVARFTFNTISTFVLGSIGYLLLYGSSIAIASAIF